MCSPELRVKVLSCLVVLSTLTRVDCLANVMDTLKIELKEDVVCVCVCVCVGVWVWVCVGGWVGGWVWVCGCVCVFVAVHVHVCCIGLWPLTNVVGLHRLYGSATVAVYSIHTQPSC